MSTKTSPSAEELSLADVRISDAAGAEPGMGACEAYLRSEVKKRVLMLDGAMGTMIQQYEFSEARRTRGHGFRCGVGKGGSGCRFYSLSVSNCPAMPAMTVTGDLDPVLRVGQVLSY